MQYTNNMMRKVLDCESYDDMCQPYDFSDFETDHGNPHMWIGGHMAALPCAPVDPIFWSHHSFVDKLGEQLQARLPASQWRYPNNWNIPYQHRPGDRMRPFPYRNAEGLNDTLIGRKYAYETSPADVSCTADLQCSPTGLLWCDIPATATTGRCKAKCRPRGACRGDVHAMCYCRAGTGTPRCVAGTCQCINT